MKRAVVPFLILFALLGLLTTLAVLQYRWLGEISDGERERLQKRLQTDSQNFATDFNKEVRNIFITFQIDADDWTAKNWSEFNSRYDVWRSQTNYQDLIDDFYFVEAEKDTIGYDFTARRFETVKPTSEINEIAENINNNAKNISFEPTLKNNFTVLIPNINAGKMTKISKDGIPHIEPKLFGYLVIKLNEDSIKRLLSDLSERYFPPDNAANYNLSVINQADSKVIFQTAENLPINMNVSDFKIPIFNLSVTSFNMITNSSIFTEERSEKEVKEIKLPPLPESINKKNSLRIRVLEERVSSKPPEFTGLWTLNVKHSAGSLDQFIQTTRNKNLAISFGILSLLAVSIILIFLSAQRAERLAQKQLDFVSGVSHEFRTPLAVIYSASENLTDGVVNSDAQVEKYGNLIKGEGKKLSRMVEQILEFAGAKSGKRKYDFREVSIEENNRVEAINECQPLIDEKDFTLETEIAENLPKISANEQALTQAVQNLIANSIKYSNGNKWLKISAKNGGENVKIAVEDKGIGISAKDKKHIFEPFYRGKKVVDDQISGNGLGLSLVKQIVQSHGGKIEVESEIGKGSKFIIQLPIEISV